MGEFKRSPSKVWWASDSLEWREVSKSPGSQDSGFSDTETSPPLAVPQPALDLYKAPTPNTGPNNLSSNFVEKTTPDKSLHLCESPRRSRYTKNSPKVSRNLFRNKDVSKDVSDHHQYSKDVVQDTTTHERTSSDSWSSETDSFNSVKFTRSLPFIKTRDITSYLNRSAPPVLQDIKDDEESSFNGNHSLSSDCESELECLFNSPFHSPKHTSTPKANLLNNMRHRRQKLPLAQFLKNQQEKVPEPAKKWMEEARQNCEQEYMITLQTKSIAGELNQKVNELATQRTADIRNLLVHSECIQRDYQTLNGEKTHVSPLAQSLAGNIIDFIQTYSKDNDPAITKLYDEIRKAKSEEVINLVLKLFNLWQPIYQEIKLNTIKKLISKLENPCSEMDLRATVTGITSISLRNEDLVDIFTKNDIIPVLLILCEKCEGSSIRSLLLRALSTMCCSTSAVRQFEKYSGIQIVTDTLGDDLSRPEPERSEAVALLAQVTAPWIEDNHSIKGLLEHTRRLVKSLTRFVATTKCCQNLLLCAAALANLSTMESKCLKYMLHLNTSEVLLEMVTKRGPCASVYLLEQVATLLANVAALEVGRKQLTEMRASGALLRFMRVSGSGGDAEKRLQQKAVIALSRLCGEQEASRQVVEMGGVERLVKMCREKNGRFDNDAVLVATLATLRKIVDTCGSEVVSAEDAQEFIEPKLLDSFLAYSTQSESYV